LAKILRKQGNYIDAEKTSVEAMKLARQFKHRNYLAILLLEAGRVALGRKEYDKAQEFLGESLEVVAYSDDKAQVFLALAMLNHHKGNLSNARRCYGDALAFDFPETKYSCTVKLGILCLEEGKAEEARDYFARGIALCRELLEKTPRLYDALYHLALAQLGIGQSDEALATYRQALEVCSAKGVVQNALQDLRLLQRAAQPVAGLEEAIVLLSEAIKE
jgi:tetratricopeptide (TPR) repeat protein